MKKFFAIMLMAFALVGFQACKENNGVSVVYNIAVVGDADGDVTVTFPNGSLELNGQAAVDFAYTNDTTKVVNVFALGDEPMFDYVLGEALESNDAEVKDAAEKVEATLVSVNAASGTYYLHVSGFAKETLTGLIFAIDREFTNRANEPVEVTE